MHASSAVHGVMRACVRARLLQVYVFFGVVAMAGAAYVSAKVPETKGKTLEQIEAELKGGKTA